MTGRHGRSGFSAQGLWQATSDGGWQLTLSGLNADRVNADPDFIAALPPCVQRVIDRLKPTGTIDMLGTTMHFAKRPGVAQLAASWDVQLACHQTALRGDLPVDSLTGGVRVMGQSDGPNCNSYGELAIDSLIWNDVQFTNLRGPFWADNSYCFFGQGATAKLGQPPRRLTAGGLWRDARERYSASARGASAIPHRCFGGRRRSATNHERTARRSEGLNGTVSGTLVARRGREVDVCAGREWRAAHRRCEHLQAAGAGGPLEGAEQSFARYDGVRSVRRPASRSTASRFTSRI